MVPSPEIPEHLLKTLGCSDFVQFWGFFLGPELGRGKDMLSASSQCCEVFVGGVTSVRSVGALSIGGRFEFPGEPLTLAVSAQEVRPWPGVPAFTPSGFRPSRFALRSTACFSSGPCELREKELDTF